uniref:OmpA domain-containing protein n=1 Tax=uncultured marine group II/III euryarchaeote KM3_80_G12 TaxID=1456515 RepID=A0A075HNP1_9EURY|nr:OmpA domain-containing protein [uncultured marine group II/III euryarchaeote KM3_80_G12]
MNAIQSEQLCSRTALILSFLILSSTLLISSSALAADGDGDGIDDALDDCQFAAGNSTSILDGCPDSDGNGVPDSEEEVTGDWDNSGRELFASIGGGWGGSAARAVAWSPNGIYLVGGGDSNVVLLYSSGGNFISSLHTMSDDLLDLEFSPNGTYLAVSSEYDPNYSVGRVTILELDWSNFTASVVQELGASHGDDVTSVAWTDDGAYLFTGCRDAIVRQFSTSNWTEVRNFLQMDPVLNVEPTPDGRLIASTHGEELTVNWTTNGTVYMEVHNHSGPVRGLDISPDGRWLVTTGDDNRGFVYNLTNRSIQHAFVNSRDINEVSFSPDGAFIAIANDGSTSQVYLLSDMSQVDSFGSFGTSNQNRGTFDVAWSPDGLKLAYAQRRGRITMHILPEGYLRLKGDITAELMLWRWRSDWLSDGHPLTHDNSTTTQVTQALCNDEQVLGTLVEGLERDLVTLRQNHTTSGKLECQANGRELIEVSIGRIPATLIVRDGGLAHQCIQALGGLSMAQVRWIFTSATDSQLSIGGWAPAMNLSSVVPDDDEDGKREWSDLNSSVCPSTAIELVGRWSNRSVPTMIGKSLLCTHCQFGEDFYAATSIRDRYELETRSSILFTMKQPTYTDALGFTELVAAAGQTGLWQVPLIDNWTHGAGDAVSSGGSLVLPSVDASRNGSWPLQGDYQVMFKNDTIEVTRNFVEWLLSPTAQQSFLGIGFVDLGPLALVNSWARMGHNKSFLLPDGDADGVWDADDDCPNTDASNWSVDEFGCAENQLDTDGDGLYNHEDDCSNVSGSSQWPTQGCPDRDGDGWEDGSDAFPDDVTQWRDSDSDNYGDEAGGMDPDACPQITGDSTQDRLGCPDQDGDGWSDPSANWSRADGADFFPSDITQWRDSDADGHGDNYLWTDDGSGLRANESGDAFPSERTQWRDRDGDSFGDNLTGLRGDSCPLIWGDSTQNGTLGCPDADGDGYWDGDDAFVNDSTQWIDSDADGLGDRTTGNNPDRCPLTPSDELDLIDSDGCGPSELDADSDGVRNSDDLCPQTPASEAAYADASGCSASQRDSDADGYSDTEDWAPDDPTQWADADGDGFGDNQSGTNGDACILAPGTSWRDRIGCPDLDRDGQSDVNDALPSDSTQWSDHDQDGFFDNWDDPDWNSTRCSATEECPGEFVVGATWPDACPLRASSYAIPLPGCPPTGIGSGVGTTSDGGIPSSMWLLIGVALVVVALLGVGMVFALRKPQKQQASRKRARVAHSTQEFEQDELGLTTGSEQSGVDYGSADSGYGLESEQDAQSGLGIDSESAASQETGAVGEQGGENSEQGTTTASAVTLDEHGTEWWQAEDGAWWYRNAGQTEWSSHE